MIVMIDPEVAPEIAIAALNWARDYIENTSLGIDEIADIPAHSIWKVQHENGAFPGDPAIVTMMGIDPKYHGPTERFVWDGSEWEQVAE